MANLQTIIQYLTLIILMVAGFLLITSICQQDWMREELSMKIPKEMFDTVKNQTNSMIPKQQADMVFGYMNTIPSDASVELKVHCGLQQTCVIVTMDGFENPMKLMIPEIKWCLQNDFFTKPTKYGLADAIYFDYLEDEAQALQHARICMIVALLCLVLAVVVLMIKVYKWQQGCVFATILLALLSCICVVAALGLIHSKFEFKKDFDMMKASVTSPGSQNIGYGGMYGGRRRRDDGSPGYSGRYTTEGPDQESRTVDPLSGGMSGAGQIGRQLGMSLIQGTELKEEIGSPLKMAGLGMGLLLLVILFSLAEAYLIRKHGGIEIKYQNVELA